MKHFQNLGNLNKLYISKSCNPVHKLNNNNFRSSTEDEEEDGSISSCNARRNDGAAFPKAFDCDLVTPNPVNRPNDALVN